DPQGVLTIARPGHEVLFESCLGAGKGDLGPFLAQNIRHRQSGIDMARRSTAGKQDAHFGHEPGLPSSAARETFSSTPMAANVTRSDEPPALINGRVMPVTG